MPSILFSQLDFLSSSYPSWIIKSPYFLLEQKCTCHVNIQKKKKQTAGDIEILPSVLLLEVLPARTKSSVSFHMADGLCSG